MYILALAVDYDGTLAEHGYVDAETLAALRRLRESGRRLLLVTGRELTDLRHACAHLDLFDCIVAENGALLYEPASGRELMLADAAPAALVQRLEQAGVAPISVGRSIIATWKPHEHTVMEAIRELGLDLHMLFNKDAIMILPSGVNKASGLRRALRELDLSAMNLVAVGDAENDHAFLSVCGGSAAVANALPALREMVDIRLAGDHGRGIVELIERILVEDAALLPEPRRGIVAGHARQEEAVYLFPFDVALLLGNSGCGKSSYVTLLSERMHARGFEFCIIDPEGDYQPLEHALTVGGAGEAPTTEQALHSLLQADISVVVNTVALGADARQALFADLAPALRQMRARSGRPHWLVIDEAHYTLPGFGDSPGPTARAGAGGLLVTLSPDMLDAEVLQEVDVVMAMGSTAAELLRLFAQRVGREVPESLAPLGEGEFLFWRLGQAPRRLLSAAAQQEHHRHCGKYACGDVGYWSAFYFPTLGKRARNLGEFLELAAQLAPEDWLRHLRAGDYSAWFRRIIHDDVLARQTQAIEHQGELEAAQSLWRIRRLLQERYTLAAPAIAVED